MDANPYLLPAVWLEHYCAQQQQRIARSLKSRYANYCAKVGRYPLNEGYETTVKTNGGTKVYQELDQPFVLSTEAARQRQRSES